MSRKTVAIQQPEHLPWLGFFNKMSRCDQFVYLDNVQFKKRYFENRNRIKYGETVRWLTVPVMNKGRYLQKICDVEIDEGRYWRKKYMGMIKHAYSKKPFYEEYINEFEKILYKNFAKLIDLNLEIINWIREKINITTASVMASQLKDYTENGSDLILNICKDCGADTYVSGPDGENYLNTASFSDEGISIEYHNYVHPVYNQSGTAFISHLSAMDLLMNHGENSDKYIKGVPE